MNWYKKANLYDEIKKHGPKAQSIFSKDIPYDEGEYESLIQYLQNKREYSREQAEKELGIIPEHYRKDYFQGNYGWSVPTEESINKLKQFIGDDIVLEIGSGYGLWAKLLQDIEIKVIPTTRVSKEDDFHVPRKDHSFTKVENLIHSDAIQKYPQANVLMMSWPPYSDPMAYEALTNFQGNKIIYIGEGSGGCTGCDNFHELLYREWQEVEDIQIDIPQWQGLHDRVELFVRK